MSEWPKKMVVERQLLSNGVEVFVPLQAYEMPEALAKEEGIDESDRLTFPCEEIRKMEAFIDRMDPSWYR
jgi:hypothetical protein